MSAHSSIATETTNRCLRDRSSGTGGSLLWAPERVIRQGQGHWLGHEGDCSERSSSELLPMRLPPLPVNPLFSIICRVDGDSVSGVLDMVVDAVKRTQQQLDQRLEVVAMLDGPLDDDDLSTDVDCGPVLHTVRVDWREGEASAFNAAYALSTGDVICWVDTIDPSSLVRMSQMIGQLQRRPDAGVVLSVPSMSPERSSGWLAGKLICEGGRWLLVDGGFALRRETAENLFPLPGIFRFGARYYLLTLALLLTEAVSVTVSEPATFGPKHAAQIDWLTPDRIRDLASFMIEREAAINLRLDELGIPERRFELEHDLGYRQVQLARLMLETPRSRRVVTSLIRLVPRLLLDDQLATNRKLAAIAAYLASVFQSGEPRRRSLTTALQTSGVGDHYAGLVGTQKVGN